MKIEYFLYFKKERNKQILYLISFPYRLILKILDFFKKRSELYNLKCKNHYIELKRFGRFGNNIQQLLIAFINIKEYNLKIKLDNHFINYLSDIGLDLKKLNKLLNKNYEFNFKKDIPISKALYFYNETPLIFNKHYTRARLSNSFFNLLRIDSYTSEGNLFKNLNFSVEKLRPIFRELINENYNKKLEPFYESDEVCFLHLRSGDINNHNLDHFVTNPLSFYKWLNGYFKKIIIITEPGKKHILLDRICNIFDVLKIQSSESFIEDFSTISKCRNLATSGVSTFPIAASIFNDNLKNFYYSNIYLKEHLNPTFLRINTNKICFNCDSYWNKWFNTNKIERSKLILNS